MSSTEIKFNKEQANYGIEQLKQCQKELYEADKLFYKGIMALASAKGMDLILREDAGINLYMPEKIVIECREEVASLIEEISSKIALVQDFNEEPKEETDTVQYRKTETVEKVVRAPGAQPLYGVPTPEVIEPIESEVVTGPIQALYGVPTPEVIEPIEGGVVTGPIQALYGPPAINPSMPVQPMYGVVTPTDQIVQPMYGVITPTDPIVQPMYGVVTPTDPIVQPMYGVITPTDPIVQPMYGVITPTDPIVQPMYGVITPTDPIVQPMYGVITPTDPIVQPMYGVITPIDPIVQPMYGVITPTDPIVGPIENGTIPNPEIGVPITPSMPEYETIPNTGIPGIIEKNYISKHPRLIGGLAATVGLFGIPTILSDDYEEEEERKMNEKED